MSYILVVALFLTASGLSQAQQFTVSVEANGAYEAEIASFIGRELRSLGDVDVTSDKASYAIIIVALKSQNKGGQDTGYAMSVVFTEPVGDFTCRMLAEPTNDGSCRWLKSKVELLNQFILIGGDQDVLRKQCASIVAKLDSEELQVVRKLQQRLKSTSAK